MAVPARTAVLLLSGGVLTALTLGAALLPMPYVRLSPGPTVNVLDTGLNPPPIVITGTTTYPTSGHFNLTTVSELGGPRTRLSLPQAVVGLVDADQVVVPERSLFAPDTSGDQIRRADRQSMELSQENAISAAVNYLKIPAEQQVVIREVAADSPADGNLQVADIVVAIDGSAVTAPEQVRELVRKVAPGQPVTFTVIRSGNRQDVRVVTAPSPADPAVPYVGVVTAVVVKPPFDVTISLDRVGGPSAGLIFSLGIIDQLTPVQENGGKFVAGTGTIDPAGTVGAIGGLPQKLAAARNAGAEVFLVPTANCQDVGDTALGSMKLVKVATLTDAVDALAAIRDGGPAPAGC